ncbi:hypothetical protein AJ78_08781 [Emergomyces pasteurianus Ep9510]|uniref:DUF7924 domain-containing protein n=1 Tax=Emergomyces pasteurianus Ep9510 TaxID=1447872 RepID=A0A1J9P2H8_9EURO|nr:hypothetical protein AJ78_08781 [Emergomyces pasteurianus Ep9510]
MSHLLARKKSTSSLHRKPSKASSTTPRDQKPREEKSALYRNARYRTLLEIKDSFIKESKLGIVNASKSSYQTLLDAEQRVPKNSLFQNLAIYDNEHLKILIENVSEGWDNVISVTKPRLQSDYSVDFRREAFTDGQLQRLQPFVSDLTNTSYFMTTFYMYFSFLTCEVKCGAAALDIADQQNVYSATIAVRAIIELFKLVKREKEIDQEILVFSVLYDHTAVRIYGHYTVLEEEKTNFYRHPLSTSSILPLWMAKRNGRRTNSREMFMIYRCQLILKEYALQLIRYLLMWILTFRSRNFNTLNNSTLNRCLPSRMMTASEVSAILPRQMLRQLPPLQNKHKYQKAKKEAVTGSSHKRF